MYQHGDEVGTCIFINSSSYILHPSELYMYYKMHYESLVSDITAYIP